MDGTHQNVVPLDHLRDTLLCKVYSIYDVPEILHLAGVSKGFLELITQNQNFIKGYNLRDKSEVWSFNHVITEEFEPLGVLWGTRLSDKKHCLKPISPELTSTSVKLVDGLYDKKQLIKPISLKPGSTSTSVNLVDTSGSFSLFTLGNDSRKLLVLNPFGKDTYIKMLNTIGAPSSFFVTSEVFRIMREDETFSLVHASVYLKENVPVVTVYSYRQKSKAWSGYGCLSLGNELADQVDLESDSTLFLENNNYLYTLCVLDGCYFHARQPLITPPSLPKTVYKMCYVGSWAIQFQINKSDGWIPTRFTSVDRLFVPILVSVTLYRRNDIFSSFAYVTEQTTNWTLPSIETMSTKIFEGILHVQFQRLAVTEKTDICYRWVTCILRYHIQKRIWLSRIVIPCSPIKERVWHGNRPILTDRLTLPSVSV